MVESIFRDPEPQMESSHESDGPSQQDDRIIISGDITDEDRHKIYTKLGRPKTYNEYDLKDIVPENYPNGHIIEDFKKQAYDNGMSNEGVRRMAEWYKNVEVKQAEAYKAHRAQQDDMNLLALKKEWGSGFELEVKNARKAIDAYTDKAFRKYMDESGLGNNPALVKAFAKIGRELSEDKLVQSDSSSQFSRSEEARKSEILKLRSDKEFMERYRRGDKYAVQRFNSLYLDN